MNSTSERSSSTEDVDNVGTKSEPLITEVIKSFPDSAKSHVMQAAVMKMVANDK